MAATLRTTVNGMEFENPFLLASGPPGTNARVICRSFDLGWGGVVAKTISLDASKVINVSPRYAKLRDPVENKTIVGFENIELVSDRPFETWLEEFKQIKADYPNNILVASVMEEYDKQAWQEIIQRVQETGVDAFELNFSCPHGMPERKMGMAMGQNPDIAKKVCEWVMEVAEVPVWAKMTPNVANITEAPEACLNAGVDGISAINTILSVMGVNLKTLKPMPTVAGYSTPGGYSGQAVRPIALRQVMEITRAFPDTEVSGMGGISTGYDAAEFFLLGCSTVQVCTGAMLQGYEVISKLKAELLEVMNDHGCETIDDLKGKALEFFTTHTDLVERQAIAKAEKAATGRDDNWKGKITDETDSLTSN